MYREDTIAAIATPPGEGGIAIVRVSGVDAEAIASRIFAHGSSRRRSLQSHKLYHGAIRDPRNGRVLDRVLLTIMRRPRSYTAEDVVEIHCHGGMMIVRQILALVLREGARQAESGEFTKRAFLNGKLDLAQAEAVLDLIRAPTARAAEIAFEQANGALSEWIGELRDELLDLLVQVEAAIDFPEEEIELLQRRQLVDRITFLEKKIHLISNTYNWARLFREGARVCICGRPNVGKSSLLNALVGEDRVIVTPLPGTTRDVIEEAISLDGLPVVLWDTAGIRETDDEIESAGIALTRRHVNRADAIVLVLDGAEELTMADETLLDDLSGNRCLVAVNKTDLPIRLDVARLQQGAPDARIKLISARDGTGITELKCALRQLLLDSELEVPVVVTNERHRSALDRSANALEQSAKSIGTGLAPEFAAVDLNEARKALEEIIGKIESDDILERIFANFCIGK